VPPTHLGRQPTSHLFDHVPHRLPQPPDALGGSPRSRLIKAQRSTAWEALDLSREVNPPLVGSMGAATGQQVERMFEYVGHRFE
jgi:hypothetical protein